MTLKKNNTSKNSKPENKVPFYKSKGFWISLAVSFLIASALTALIILINYFMSEPTSATLMYKLFIDGFGISGLLMLCFYGLSWVGAQGTFDILAYSIKATFRAVFDYKRWKNDPNRDYYHYKMKKDSEDRKPLLAILFVSVIFITVSVILLIPYYQLIG